MLRSYCRLDGRVYADVMGRGRDDLTFEDFVRASQTRLIGYAIRLTGDVTLARDLVQEALLRAGVRWSRILNQQDPTAYVQVTVARLFIDGWRRGRREFLTDRAGSDTPARQADQEARLDVHDALRGLAPRQRAVLVLRYYLDMSEVEIAEALSVTPGTVKSTASDARAQLRVSLDAYRIRP